MSNTGLLFFTPHVGDTILATALSNKISKHFGMPVLVANQREEMQVLTQDLGGTGIYHPKLSEFMEEGTRPNINLAKKFQGASDFAYRYRVTFQRQGVIERLASKLLDTFTPHRFDTLFLLHYSYEYAKLGQLAKEIGIKVYGYCLDERNRLYFSKGNTDLEIPSLWTKDFIGDRLSKYITGQPLTRQDYATLGESTKRKGVKLFPTSRSGPIMDKTWTLDMEVLESKELDFSVHWHTSELRPTFSHGLIPNKQSEFHLVAEMYGLINSSEFIICYESASFHLAWLSNTPAIVKLKGGFNEEWIPTWVKQDPNYYFIPSNEMYEEEYVSYLNEGLRRIT